MAWALPKDRCTCPGCGYSERILVINDAEGKYRLSCGWCARVSGAVDATEAFFGIWGGNAADRRQEDALWLPGLTVHWRGTTTDYKSIQVRWSQDRAEVQVA